MPRNPKGTVAVRDKDGWIQLRWRYQGKRYYLGLGLAYDAINCRVAEQRASQIQLDMLSDNFDTTLQKYKSSSQQAKRTCSAVALFEKFIQYKKKRVQRRTLEKYHGLLGWLTDFFGQRSANPEDAETFVAWLSENMEPVTAKERLGLLKAAWEWGMKKDLVAENPWIEITIRSQPKQKPKPFTKQEVRAIIDAFATSESYGHYADYVRFKFQTGCRTGEVSGLRWRHLKDDCSVCWFGEAHTHGTFKEVKMGKARDVKLSVTTQQMLQNRRPVEVDPDDLVFPAPRGGAINEQNFSKRAWRSILEQCEVSYRVPYNTRHTFISHCLEAGMNPVEVAQITGHDPKTLYEHYAGLIKSTPAAPDLFT